MCGAMCDVCVGYGGVCEGTCGVCVGYVRMIACGGQVQWVLLELELQVTELPDQGAWN